MNEALQTSRPETCGDSRSAIFSQESPVGVSPSIAQESPQLDLFGQALAPAKISVAPAKEKASKVKEIYGRTSFGSSASADLSESLANRLARRLDTVGSTVYRQIWRRKVTPLGRRYSEHTALARTTRDSGCTGWPTPTLTDAEKRGCVSPRPGMMGLSETAPMSGWPTPKVPTGGANSKREQRGAGGADLQEAVTLASWPTPRQEDSEKTGAHNGKADTLHSATQLAGWKTPHASDGEGGTMEIRPNTAGHYKLRYQAELAGWATPRVTNNCGCPSPDVTGRGSRLEDQAALTVPFSAVCRL